MWILLSVCIYTVFKKMRIKYLLHTSNDRSDEFEALCSPSPIIAAFARASAANVMLVDEVNTVVHVEIEKEEQIRGDIEGLFINKRKRNLQQVVLISTRVTVIKWMIADAIKNGESGVILRAIGNFPSEFRGNYKVRRIISIKRLVCFKSSASGQSYQSHEVVEGARWNSRI